MPGVNKKLFKRIETSNVRVPLSMNFGKAKTISSHVPLNSRQKPNILGFFFFSSHSSWIVTRAVRVSACVCAVLRGGKKNCRRYWEILLSSRQYAWAHFCCAYIFSIFPPFSRSQSKLYAEPVETEYHYTCIMGQNSIPPSSPFCFYVF